MLACVAGLLVGIAYQPPREVSAIELFEARSKLERKEQALLLRIGKLDGEIRELSANINLAGKEPPLKSWRGQIELDAWLGRIKHLRTYLTHHPELGIPELKLLGAEDWLSATQEGDLSTEANYRQALSKLRMNAKIIAAPYLTEALRWAIDANNGEPPRDVSELKEFLTSDIDAQMLTRYVLNSKGEVPKSRELSLIEREIIDPLWDSTSRFYSTNDVIIIEPTRIPLANSIKTALEQYNKVAKTPPTELAQLKIPDLNPTNSALADAIFSALTTKVDIHD